MATQIRIEQLENLASNTVIAGAGTGSNVTATATPTLTSVTVGNTGLIVGSSTPFSDSSGTLTLQNIDAIDATTEATLETAIDTLNNLTSATSLNITESQISDLGTTVAMVADNLSVFAATTSAQLASVINDETGTGSLVFATSPNLVTPDIGAATGTSINLGSSTTVSSVINDATMATASATALATSESVKAYVDNLTLGLSWKDSVKNASTGNESLTVFVSTGGYMDGTPIEEGDRVLLKDQTDASENGIYTVGAATGGTKATQSLTITGVGVGDDTFTIDGPGGAQDTEVYTFKASITGPFQILIGGSAAATATNTRTAIAENSLLVDPSGTGTTVTLDAKALGTGSITSSESGTNMTGEGAFTAGTNPSARALTRSTDMDASGEFTSAAIWVQRGDLYEDTGWTQTEDVTTVDTSTVSFSQFSGSTSVSNLDDLTNVTDPSSGAGTILYKTSSSAWGQGTTVTLDNTKGEFSLTGTARGITSASGDLNLSTTISGEIDITSVAAVDINGTAVTIDGSAGGSGDVLITGQGRVVVSANAGSAGENLHLVSGTADIAFYQDGATEYATMNSGGIMQAGKSGAGAQVVTTWAFDAGDATSSDNASTGGPLALTAGDATGTGTTNTGGGVNITAGVATGAGSAANTGGSVTITAGTASNGTANTGGKVNIDSPQNQVSIDAALSSVAAVTGTAAVTTSGVDMLDGGFQFMNGTSQAVGIRSEKGKVLLIKPFTNSGIDAIAAGHIAIEGAGVNHTDGGGATGGEVQITGGAATGISGTNTGGDVILTGGAATGGTTVRGEIKMLSESLASGTSGVMKFNSSGTGAGTLELAVAGTDFQAPATISQDTSANSSTQAVATINTGAGTSNTLTWVAVNGIIQDQTFLNTGTGANRLYISAANTLEQLPADTYWNAGDEVQFAWT